MNKLKTFILVLFISAMAAPESLSARDIEGTVVSPPTPPPTTTSRNDCNPSTSSTDLNINNVRARLLGGGDLWWDLSDGRYVIPNVPLGEQEVSSIFAAAVWIGGFDDGGNLKIAAQTYRQTGNDFWPGPLDDNGETQQSICNSWDRHFEVLGENIDRLTADYLADDDGDGSSDFIVNEEPAEDLLRWPAKGNPHFASRVGFSLPNQNLAPFFDADGDGLYDPKKGDFPIIGITDCDIADVGDATYGDQMVFWIYNDKGNIHTETGGDQIGMEVHALAFAFSTDDEINNMSFYKYSLFNKATESLNDTYIAQWADPDLGCYLDDFVGCNIEEIDGKPRNLGIVYNGDADDADCSGVNGYGSVEIPMLGIDYFRGPKDENGDEIGMSAFIYYNNDFSSNGNPEIATDFYGYMSGFWKDGSPVEFGGDGFQEGTFPTPFMFPSDPTEPNGPGVWSECSVNNDPADRRFLESSGPFTLNPGATNEIIVGAVWIPRGQYPCPSFTPLLAADDVAQKLFDNCFDLVDGPDAPEIEIVELDRELVLSLVNLAGNNIGETYQEQDPFISPALTDDLYYEFQGYILYQLSTGDISPSEYDDPSKARQIAIVDIKDGVKKIVNYEAFEDPDFFDGKIPVIKIQSPDQGVLHTFNLTNDLFATGDSRLVNHTKYYYSVVAYAYNNWLPYDVFTNEGQEKQYLPGRRNIKVYTAIPHFNQPEVGGTILNSKYGSAPEITRLDGVGNSGFFLDLTDASVDDILTNGISEKITYKANSGPFSAKVVNPMNVSSGKYLLSILDNNLSDDILKDSIYWSLKDVGSSDVWYADRTIERQDERLISDLGISVTMKQVPLPGAEPMGDNGFIGATSEQLDGGDPWYGGLPDGPPGSVFNFIRTDALEADEARDPLKVYSGVLGGSWYPYALCAWKVDPAGADVITPVWTNNFSGQVDLRSKLLHLESVDVVLTSDKSKWSRCPVVNTFSRAYNTEGWVPTTDAGIFKLRTAESVGKDGQPDGDGTGMGWFPGYAYNVETGERLNVYFGENALYDEAFSMISGVPTTNGADMIWNPNSDAITPVQNPPFITSFAEVPVGGQHTIYVTKTSYDEGATLRTKLGSTSPVAQIEAWSSVIWTSIPLLPPNTTLTSIEDGLIPSDVRFKLRVNSPYEFYEGVVETETTGYPKYEFSFEGFNTVNNDFATAESALDLVQVVPNPYYAFSTYENTQFENKVKITNLPNQATITIFSMDGRLIRRYNRNEVVPSGLLYDQVVTSLEWDLKNSEGIPVASGVYMIHVDGGALGERVVKWFGAMRKFDTLGL